MADAIADTIGPFIGEGVRLGALFATLVICWRLFNSTWSASSDMLRKSADYAREEAAELRQRVDDLEAKAIDRDQVIATFTLREAEWTVERGNLERHIADLELAVVRLEQQVTQQRKDYP